MDSPVSQTQTKQEEEILFDRNAVRTMAKDIISLQEARTSQKKEVFLGIESEKKIEKANFDFKEEKESEKVLKEKQKIENIIKSLDLVSQKKDDDILRNEINVIEEKIEDDAVLVKTDGMESIEEEKQELSIKESLLLTPKKKFNENVQENIKNEEVLIKTDNVESVKDENQGLSIKESLLVLKKEEKIKDEVAQIKADEQPVILKKNEDKEIFKELKDLSIKDEEILDKEVPQIEIKKKSAKRKITNIENKIKDIENQQLVAKERIKPFEKILKELLFR